MHIFSPPFFSSSPFLWPNTDLESPTFIANILLSTISTYIAHVPLNSKSFVLDNFFWIDLNRSLKYDSTF